MAATGVASYQQDSGVIARGCSTWTARQVRQSDACIAESAIMEAYAVRRARTSGDSFQNLR